MLKIQEKDFEIYIAKVKKAYELYKKNNNSRLKKHKSKEQVNITGTLMKCYEIVPVKYFDPDFVFNFAYFTKEKEKIAQLQENLGEFLDHVELNLYYQITNRFQEFLDVILKLNQMDIQIHNCLHSIKFFREFNKELRVKCADKVNHVLKLKRRKMNIEKTIRIFEFIKVVQNTLPAIKSLIQQNNFKYAVELVKQAEETYKNKLKAVKALKNFHTNFNETRLTLEKLLTGEFEDRCLSYISPTFSYNKALPDSALDVSAVEESFMNISVADLQGLDEKPSAHSAIYWTLNSFQTNEETENNIAKIVLEFIKIKDFPLKIYKTKILDVMKKFHKQFLNDMNEYIDNVKKSEGSNVDQTTTFDLHIKFVLFYFELFKRFLTSHFNLVHKILRHLVEFYDESFPDKSEYNIGYQVLDQTNITILTETVNEFYSSLAMIIKFFNEKMNEVITNARLDSITIHQFSKLVQIFEEISNFFQNTMKIDDQIKNWISTDRDSLKKPLQKCVASMIEKLNISPLQNLRIDTEKNFIAGLHKQNIETLRSTLE